jgi:AraC family transcriptional regulator
MGDAKTPAVLTDARVASAMAGAVPRSAPAVEVLRHGRPDALIPETSSVATHAARWDGLALESFTDLPPVAIPDHEHPTHLLSLLLRTPVEAEWTTGGRTQRALNAPGTIYLLPKGTRDRLAWKARSDRVLVTLEPRLLTGALEQTAHLDDLELQTHWQLEDRHLLSLIQALRADVEDGCPAGRLFGESLGTALAVYLARRYASVRTRPTARGGLPGYRLQRVRDYVASNLDKDLRLAELAALSGTSPHHFAELFRQSTRMSPHRFVLVRRIERSKELLRSQAFSVLDVALQTGFSNQSHFTKVFRRLTGITPSAFRAEL